MIGTEPAETPEAQPKTPEIAPKKLTAAMLRLTAMVTIGLSLTAGAVQLFLDLLQEMDHVEVAASTFVESLVPAAEKAVWEFDENAAFQVADGLYTQAAIVGVTIISEGEIFHQSTQQVEPTLPLLPSVMRNELTVLTRDLLQPREFSDEGESRQVIGSIEITVDRSLVSPTVINRLLTYFGVAVLKNSLLCVCLALIAFSGIARHVLSLSNALSSWRSSDGAIALEKPPGFLRGTEIETLGQNIAKLTSIAGRELVKLRMSNDKISDLNSVLLSKSEDLSQALQRQNQELEGVNAKLLELATRDSLTGAFNRRHFEETAEALWSRHNTADTDLSIILSDIDFFKKYNDHYGHPEGDDCLRVVAQTMSAAVEASGGVFARYGGEEFIALLTTEAEAEAVAARLVRDVAALGREHAKSLIAAHVTVSVGLAKNQDVRAATLDDLINAADLALYSAKKKGRNQHQAAGPELLAASQNENAIDDELRKAIRERAFEPYFQPQVDARDGRIVGVETLARWIRSDGRVFAPAEFLSTSEKLGVMARVDAIIQEKALDKLTDWIDRGIAPLRFSLNLSEEALLTGQVARLLKERDKSVKRFLTFELLESIALEKKSTAFDMRLDEIVELGARLEIDDFGTGATSINALANIAPERIKIARELVSMIGVTPQGRTVVKAVVEIAQAFGIDLIAEGVETHEQAQTLIAMGIPIQQGFLHAKPMPAAEVESLFLRGPQEVTGTRERASGERG